jgi:hypothetical protein
VALSLDETPLPSPPVKEKPEKPKEDSLTDKELSILAMMEQIYWQTGRLPSKEMVVERLDPFQGPAAKARVTATFNKQRFQDALEKRGLEYKNDTELLTPKQLVLVNMLLNVEDKKSLRQKLELLGITSAQYQAWLRDPGFHSYLTMRTEQLFEHSDHEAYKSLLQAVMRGDTAAMKLFFEMRGIYNPRIDVNINIETVVYKLIEIVGKHVKDPNLLQAIAKDVEVMEISR